MGAAAEFDRIGAAIVIAHGDDADFLAVLFAEQGAGTFGNRGVGGHQAGGDFGVLADAGVHFGFDDGEVVAGDGGGLADVEAQAVGGVETAFLGDVVTEAAAEGFVQEVSGGVVGADGTATGVVDGGDGGFAEVDGALGHAARWTKRSPSFFWVSWMVIVKPGR